MRAEQFTVAQGQHKRPICYHCGVVLRGSARLIARVANCPIINSDTGTTYKIIAKAKTIYLLTMPIVVRS